MDGTPRFDAIVEASTAAPRETTMNTNGFGKSARGTRRRDLDGTGVVGPASSCSRDFSPTASETRQSTWGRPRRRRRHRLEATAPVRISGLGAANIPAAAKLAEHLMSGRSHSNGVLQFDEAARWMFQAGFDRYHHSRLQGLARSRSVVG